VPLREGRPFTVSVCHRPVQVSIHAPARGATFYGGYVKMKLKSFNPRPCARGDFSEKSGLIPNHAFQSTPLREGRHSKARSESSGANGFNPRPCARGDLPIATAIYALSCFNPRPCARGDLYWILIFRTFIKFQSTPLREGRRLALKESNIVTCFNPRPCARGDGFNPTISAYRHVSIHAPARGAT